MTLVGCLQRGGSVFGGGYLLTMLREPEGAIGTSGSITQSGSSVEREQMRAAASTYRLDPQKGVDLDDKVGKEVRVTGVVAEAANLPNGAGAIGTSGDTQVPNRDRNAQNGRDTHLDTGDLAKLDVSSAVVTSASCGSRDETSGKTDIGIAGTPRNPVTHR
jgi:hypothetical protein